MVFLQRGPVAGLALQVGVLLCTAAFVPLSLVAWGMALTWAVVTATGLSRGLSRSPGRSGGPRLGPADWVTLVRSCLIGGVAALVAQSFVGVGSVPALVGLAAMALVLDAVDGAVARRTGTVSDLGARFDMEADAFLILALSVYVSRELGWWVLTIGVARYAFVAASWSVGWMRRPLPYRYWRKVVAALQGVVLTVAASGTLDPRMDVVIVGIACLLLAESFGRDVLWLQAHRDGQALSNTPSPSGETPAARVRSS